MKKFFGNYQTSGDVQTALDNGTLSKPYVALVGGSAGTLDYNTKSEIIHYENMYFTIQALEDGEIGFTADFIGDKLIYYSINGGEWTLITMVESDVTPISVSANDEVRFKSVVTSETVAKSYHSLFSDISPLWSFNVYGNILSLYYGDNFSGQTTLPSGVNDAFDGMFEHSSVVDAGNLVLIPQLPTTTNYPVYQRMFKNCTGLTTAPALLSTFIPTNAYHSMFYGCTSLSYIKCLGYITDGSDWGECFYDWVAGVPSGGTFVKSVDANDWVEGTSGIPEGWTVESI